MENINNVRNVAKTLTRSGPYLRGGGYGITPPPPQSVKRNFNKYYICLHSKVVYEDAHKQAPRGEIAGTRYVSEPQKCPKLRLRPGDPAGGAYSAPPDPLAGNGEGLPGRGRERRGGEGRERVGRGGVVREGEGLSPRTKILATALVVVIVVIVVVVVVHAHTILHVTFKTSETKPTKIL